MAIPAVAASAGTKAAAIQTAGQVGSGLFGSIIAAARAEKNAQIQFDNWKKAFDYEANYNSPVNQLNRLYEAGINPLYNSEFSAGNSIQGGMSTGSLPESLPMNTDLSQISNAYLQGKAVELQERHIENEEKQVGNETIRTEQELLESKARIENLQHQNNKTDAEVKELEQQVAASKAYVQLEQRKVNNLFLESMIHSRLADIQSRSVSNQYELQKFANATDRYQASINDARLKFEQDLYKDGGYFSNQQSIQRTQNEIDRKRVEVEESKVNLETRKLNDEEFLKYMEHYSRGLSYKGIGIGKWQQNTTIQEATRAMVASRIINERLQNLSPSDPSYVQMLNLWNEVNQDAKTYIERLQQGSRVGNSDYFQTKDGQINFLSPALQNIRTSGSLYNPTQ